MPKPSGSLVVSWRDCAADGLTYAEIARRYPDDRRRIIWWVIPLQWLTVYLTKTHQDFF